MLSDQLRNKYGFIASEAQKMVSKNVDKKDLARGIDYASIYANSPEEFDEVTRELTDHGKVALERPSGDYYRLNEPLKVANLLIEHCRIRVFDTEHPEVGYIDFEVKNFEDFKSKYLSRPYFSLLTTGEEMVELRDPKFKVRAYFPSGSF